MDGGPLNGAGHNLSQHQHQQPQHFEHQQQHPQQAQQHPYYHQQQQYTPTPYSAGPPQQYYAQTQETAPHQQEQSTQPYYSNHQAAWGNANNLQSYSYYNQQPQSYQHQNYSTSSHQQQTPQMQTHQQSQRQGESLANLSRFVNQSPATPVSTAQGMAVQQQRGPIASTSGSMGRLGLGQDSSSSHSAAGAANQLMPVRLQNVKGARTKASMRKLLMEQHAAAQVQESSTPPAKKKKVARNSVDETIESTLITSVQASPTSEPEVEVIPKKKRGRKKKSETVSVSSPSRPPIILKLKNGLGKRNSEAEAQLLLNVDGPAPAKIEPIMRRILSKEKKEPAEQVHKQEQGLAEHEHKIIRKEMIPIPRSSPKTQRPKSKGKSKASSSRYQPSPEPDPARLDFETSYEEAKDTDSESPNSLHPPKGRRRGRPRKVTPSAVKVEISSPQPLKKKRGRKPKSLSTKAVKVEPHPKAGGSSGTGHAKEDHIPSASPQTPRTAGRPPKIRRSSSNSKGTPAATAGVKKRGSQEALADSESSNPSATPVVTRPQPTTGLLDRRPLIPRRTRTPTVKRVGVPVKPTTPHVPIVGPSLKVKHGVVKFYRGSDEEEVDEPLKKKVTSRSREPLAKGTAKNENPKQPWMCVFCKLGPHNVGLGDLFGPYFVQSSKNGVPQKRETWVHSDCAIWAGDVLLVGETLRNLDAAVEEADHIPCKICRRPGATIGCCKKGCGETCHYPCAKLNGWNLNENTYHSYCRTHYSMALPF